MIKACILGRVMRSRLFHSIEKLSPPHSIHGDRQPIRMAQECHYGLSFFIRTTYAGCELIFRSGVLRGLKQYKFNLSLLYLHTREERAETTCALF